MTNEGGRSARRAARKFTAEQRAQIVAESRVAGASVREVAERHGLRANMLSYWRARQGMAASKTGAVKRAARSAVLAAVRVTDASCAEGGVIEIDLASGCVRVHGVVNSAMLREVLAAVR